MSKSACDILNDILGIHSSSLPTYLCEAVPFLLKKDAAAMDLVKLIAGDHKQTIDRLATMIMQRGGAVRQTSYPMEFTGFHDLGMDFLAEEMKSAQTQNIVSLERLADSLKSDVEAHTLALDALGAAKGHLESITEIGSL